jgi:hypothetical protein
MHLGRKKEKFESKVFAGAGKLMGMLRDEDHKKRMYYMGLQNEILDKQK